MFPGLVDTHVHLRDPGHTEREDFTTGTQAAAAGGITTILEMPISTPTVNSAEVFRQRRAIVGPKAIVDYALYGAAGHDNFDEIQAMVDEGAVAFKTFLHAPQPGREHEFVGLFCIDEGLLRDLMFVVAKTGVPHTFHCENNAMLHTLQHRLEASGRTDPMAHAEMRPTVVEDVSVATMLAIAAETGGRVQVVHMSSPRAAQLVKEAKARGVRVTGETCPHYLFLSEDELRAFGPYAKCNPVLRSNADREAFWAYVLDGTIDVIGSDHAPYVAEEKDRGSDNIFKAMAGFPGLEVQFPLMLSAYHDGRSDVERHRPPDRAPRRRNLQPPAKRPHRRRLRCRLRDRQPRRSVELRSQGGVQQGARDHEGLPGPRAARQGENDRRARETRLR